MTHASLFSGIGGAEVAASWMGWENVFHCETNPFCRKVLDYWFSNSKSYEDITKTDFTEWRGKIDVLTGGFPCQPFSQAGKRKGDTDDRYLWPEMLRAIREIQPTWVVGENVAGITNMVESGEEFEMGLSDDFFNENYVYRKEQEFTIERICKDFESEGYSVQPIVIPACAVGAPHRRDRVWFVANTECSRGNKIYNETKSQKSDGNGINCASDERIAADTESKQSKRAELDGQSEAGEQEQGKFGGICCKKANINAKYTKNDWANFPTQSPICCGDDGISDRLDGITFPKWRSESIKAYGNAWVPQVAYEIFNAIRIINK